MGGGADEDWVTAAITDDALVVEMLMRLGRKPTSSRKKLPLPMEWSVRQRRSRSSTIVKNRKSKPSQRASPSTPLTWSGATSLSGGSGGSGGGGGGYEESSRMPPPVKLSAAADRSKINGEGEKANSKRPRRKKTLSELKEEESSLLKEQRALKKEIAKWRMHLEKQRETNQKLKKIKIESQPIQGQESPEESVSYNDDDNVHQSTANLPPAGNASAESHPKFMLPDLNMPFEDEAICPKVICGVS